MSAGPGSDEDQRSAEERAEALMQRVAAQTTRTVIRVVGRAREELEDIIAEARTLNEANGSEDTRSAGERRSRS
jgi:hypothetical protein